jgi:hypothetical protein
LFIDPEDYYKVTSFSVFFGSLSPENMYIQDDTNLGRSASPPSPGMEFLKSTIKKGLHT